MTTKQLDPAQKQDVKYCIPNWLRDEQIRSACARPLPRIEQVAEKREGPVAVVCFGPSLNDTWEKLRDFQYIISCSGSHKFLLERGIIPTWHVEVDPRSHKVELLGPPHPAVEYLVASTCNPKYFDHLAGFNVKLWHVFDSLDEGFRVLPRGEWLITGGPNVGLRAMVLASFLGFRDLHIFGMDGCLRGKSHAAHHPHEIAEEKGSTCEYGGVTYRTTPSLLESARQTVRELDMMPDVNSTFYGEGLVQAMVRDRKPAPNKDSVMAFNKPELISATYRELNKRLHRENLAYGVGAGKYAASVIEMAEKLGTKSILDYGAGKGYLAKSIPFPIWEYDPAIPGKDEAPREADIVCCLDVLEHIEPDRLIYVLDDLRRVTLRVGYFVIHTGPSTKSLADGRNAHLIQQPKKWWEDKLNKFFVIGRIFETPPLLHVIVAPRVQKRSVAMSVAR